MSKRHKRAARVPGLIISIILLLIAIEFIVLMAVTKLLPIHLLFAGSLVLLTMVLFVILLTGDYYKKIMFTMGTVLGVLLLIIMLVGNLFILSTYNTLIRISGINTATSQIGVYVLKTDPAQTIMDAKDYTFGTLSNLDVENTKGAVQQINQSVDGEIKVAEQSGVVALVDSLLQGKTGAIILNHAYIPVLTEMEGYENIEDELRELEILDVDTVIQEDANAAKEGDPENIIRLYISGIDTRGKTIVNTRSDVNILATINTDTKEIVLVSTPRDYFVPLSISNGVPDKLTHAGIYGIDVSMDTLGLLYDASVKDYFRVNFVGFEKIIDALGGIEVNADVSFSTSEYSFSEGMNEVDGAKALAFARERYAFSDGDRHRGRNQMEVIRAVIEKAMSPELLSNYTDIMSAIEGSFETSIGYNTLAELVRDQLAAGGDWNIVSYSVDGTGDTRQPYSMSANAYVMIPDQTTVDTAKALMKQVVDGEKIDLNAAKASVMPESDGIPGMTETESETE